MNRRRGFQYLYLVTSVLWIGIISVSSFDPNRHSDPRIVQLWVILLAVVPPLMGFFVFFYLGPWIYHGIKRCFAPLAGCGK